jgi:hypothetical protein
VHHGIVDQHEESDAGDAATRIIKNNDSNNHGNFCHHFVAPALLLFDSPLLVS